MLAFITSSDGPEFLLTLNATNTDEAIRELAEQHRDTLVQCGNSERWIDRWVEEDQWFTPRWEANVRIINLCELITEDDESWNVSAYLIGGERSQTSHIGIFRDAYDYPWFFEYDETSGDALRCAAYQRIRLGFAQGSPDVQECFSEAWVDAHEASMPSVLQVTPALRFCEWHSDRGYQEWRHLRLYIFDNR